MKDNIINLKIEIEDSIIGKSLDVTIDDRFHDSEDDTYDINVSSLTSLYEELYDITQTSDNVPEDAVFKIDGQVFAKMVDGIHLEANIDMPKSIIEKYASNETLELSFTDVITIPYGKDVNIAGVAVKSKSYILYNDHTKHDNYIIGKGQNIGFKNEKEAYDAIDGYFSNKYSNLSTACSDLDITDVTVNGEKYKSFSLGKEIIKEPKIKQENQVKNKPIKNKNAFKP